MSRRFLLALTGLVVAALVGLLAPGTARATSLTRLTVEQMTDAADLVIRGRVVEVWVEEASNGSLWTHAQVEVLKVLKGDPATRTVVVRQLGGFLDDRVQIVEAAPRFSVGEEALMFLEHLEPGKTTVVGWYQGKFTARIDPDTGEELGVRFTVPTLQPYDHRFIPYPPPERRVRMADLERRVLDRVEAGWDGRPIPGVSMDKLARINKLQPGVTP